MLNYQELELAAIDDVDTEAWIYQERTAIQYHRHPSTHHDLITLWKRFLLYLFNFFNSRSLLLHQSFSDGCILVLSVIRENLTSYPRYTNRGMKNCQYLCLYIKNNMPKVSHYNTFNFLRNVHPRCVKCLFTNIRKQWNTLKISPLFKKNANISRANNSRVACELLI